MSGRLMPSDNAESAADNSAVNHALSGVSPKYARGAPVPPLGATAPPTQGPLRRYATGRGLFFRLRNLFIGICSIYTVTIAIRFKPFPDPETRTLIHDLDTRPDLAMPVIP